MLRLRLRSLLRRGAAERDLADELQFHLQKQIEENITAGMNPGEARYAALRAFGVVDQHKEESGDARRTGMIENLVQDFRHALRGFGRDPVLSITAAATLALCIGANTTVFSLVNTILLRPLPYPGSERIDWISEGTSRAGTEPGAGPDYYILREENRVFEDVGAYDPITLNWTGVEKPEQLDAARVTPSFFRVMGTQPMLGRYLAPGEEGAKAAPLAVLSYAFWRNEMGGDRSAIGNAITLDGLGHTVIGVMPQGFDFPHGTQIWKSLDMDEPTQLPILTTRPMRIVDILARRKREVSRKELDAEMARMTEVITAEYPKELRSGGFRSHLTVSATPLQERITGDMKPALMVLSGAVGLVLLIACVNLANLLLARATARQRELAVRLALGSGRGRIIRQMLTESMALALPGGLAGAAVAWLAVAFLNATKPLVLARHPPIALDLRTLALTLVLTIVTGLVFGMAPAWTAARISIHETLKGAGYSHSSGHPAVRLRRVLVVAELGISLVLLIGAGLLARSFVKLATAELGFPADHLLTFRVKLTRARYATTAAQRQFYSDLATRMRQVPMVKEVAESSELPLSQDYGRPGIGFQIAGHPLAMAQRLLADVNVVSPEFFSTMGMRLTSGRLFDWQDDGKSGDSVVVNETFARKYIPGEDPIGKRIELGPQNRLFGTIVGVVGDIRAVALGADPTPQIYKCTCQVDQFFSVLLARLGLIVRTTGDPRAAIGAIEGQVRVVDREQPIFDVRTMEERVAISLAPQRFQLILIGAFAAIALVLAAAGVYGVMSYLVTRRTREIGIRIAMGARPRQVLNLVVRESLVLTVLAVVAGLGGAWALTRYVRSMLYGITALDAPTLAITPLALAVIVLLAALGPARRAARVDPMTALREE
jgi:putative ABC transport system permease protein